jgi:predicted nucleotidyltransferase
MYQTLLARIGKSLDSSGIPYMVIGGQAVLLHGEPRLTRDIDITLGVDSSELTRVVTATERINLKPVRTDFEEFVRTTNVLPLVDPASSIRVDLIFSFTPYESEAIRRSVGRVLDGVTVRFASVEDLIIHKLVAGRPRDIEDVAGILARNSRLDETYLVRWLGTFRDTVHRDLVQEFRSLIHQRDSTREPR